MSRVNESKRKKESRITGNYIDSNDLSVLSKLNLFNFLLESEDLIRTIRPKHAVRYPEPDPESRLRRNLSKRRRRSHQRPKLLHFPLPLSPPIILQPL